MDQTGPTAGDADSQPRASSREALSAEAAASRLRVASVPTWVAHAPYQNPDTIEDAYIINGYATLLRDTQTSLADGEPAFHVRLVHRVLTAAGASQVAQFSTSFDPLTQELEIHSISVRRGDSHREYARRESIELIRRERNLERQILDGRLTASLIIPHVQPGDVVERSWTVFGGNPILRGYFDQWTGFGGAASLALRHRLRAPAARQVRERMFGQEPARTQSEAGGVIDRTWSVERTERDVVEPFTPPWRLLQRSLQLSDVESWNALSKLYAPYYAREDYPESLRAEAARIAAQTAAPAERMMAVLAAVQKRLRYLSLVLGEGGIIPRPLAEIWDTGYGDCKDASCVFAALAKLCELDAVPALVATQYGPALPEWLPGASGFDHCIVRVRIGDAVYWIDPTIYLQSGRAEHLSNPHFGWALPLLAEGSGLEEMVLAAPELTLDVREILTFGPKVSSAARLELVLKHFGGFADLRRRQIANQGLSAVAEHYLKRYQGQWPQIAESDPMRVAEDANLDCLTLSVAYALPTPWKTPTSVSASFSLPDFDLLNELGKIATNEPRHSEIFLGRPRILRKQTEAHMPRRWEVSSKIFDDQFAGARFTKSLFSTNGNVVNYKKELTVSAATSPASEIAGYRKLAEALNDRGGLTLSGNVANDKFVDSARKQTRSALFYVSITLIGLMMLGRIIAAITGASQGPAQNTAAPVSAQPAETSPGAAKLP